MTETEPSDAEEQNIMTPFYRTDQEPPLRFPLKPASAHFLRQVWGLQKKSWRKHSGGFKRSEDVAASQMFGHQQRRRHRGRVDVGFSYRNNSCFPFLMPATFMSVLDYGDYGDVAYAAASDPSVYQCAEVYYWF